MANSIQSNPVYYSLASLTSGGNSSVRTVVLHRRSDHDGFGVYIGEDIPSGLYVVTVERNSPASDANIQPGDRVLAFNGQPVASIGSNPKEMLTQAATNAPTLALTIKSTDLFQTLDMPLINTSNLNQNGKQQNIRQFTSRHTIDPGTDLEGYIRSLFADENIEILQTSSEKNIRPKSHSLRQPTNNRKTHHTRKGNENKPHRPRPALVTVETQTSREYDENGNGFDEQSPSSPSHPTYPKMGVNPVAPKKQPSNPSDNLKTEPNHRKSPEFRKVSASTASEEEPSLTEKPAPYTLPSTTTTTAVRAGSDSSKPNGKTANNQNMTHMVDVVSAAMEAKRNNPETENRTQVAARGPPLTTQPPKEPVYSSATGPSTPPLLQQTKAGTKPSPPPSYTEKPNNVSTITNRDSTDGNSYHVPTGQVNQVDNVRQLHLTRLEDFHGFGFHLQYNKKYYLVQSVEPNSPATNADLQPNEVILSINGQKTATMQHAFFVQIVNGSSAVDFVVQPLTDYLRVNPSVARNQSSTASSSAHPEQEKPKRGFSKAMEKIANH